MRTVNKFHIVFSLIIALSLVGCGQDSAKVGDNDAVKGSTDQSWTDKAKTAVDATNAQKEEIAKKVDEAAAQAKKLEEEAIAKAKKLEEEAIAKAKELEAKAKELLAKANTLLNSEKFDEAIKIAKEVLAKYDPNSAEAKGIIEKAKEQLKKMADQAVEDAKSGLTDAIGGLGQ